MFPNNKIIEIFSICDDFNKVFDKTLEQKPYRTAIAPRNANIIAMA